MALSVMQDWGGPDWPLGLILVPTPGTPVNIMSLVDANNVNAPGTPTRNNTPNLTDEYTHVVNQIVFQGLHQNANNNGLTVNTGNVYIVRRGQASGNNSGTKADYGAIVGVIPAGGSYTFLETPWTRNGFSPYRYHVDADNANDGALVTAWVG